MIKVLRIITRMNIGGPAIQAVLLFTELNKERFKSLLISGSVGKKEGDMSYLAGKQGVEPISVPELRRELNPLNDFVSFYKIYKFIRKEKPDVVHTHMSKAGMVARLAAKFAGVPLIVHTYHGHVFHSYFNPARTKFFLMIERSLANITDRIITISEIQKDELMKYLHLKDKNKFALIPLGFDLTRLLNQDDNYADTLREELGVSKEALMIGIVGRLTAIKHPKMFLEVAKEIKNRIPEKKVKFLIVGDGELKDELVNLSGRFGIKNDVIFTGWRKDLLPIYRALDVVALTSLNEGTPVSLIEALASARPAVATDVGGVRDVVEDGRSGFVVPPNDIGAFSEAAVLLLTDKDKRKKFGLYGREAVRYKYSKERLIKAIENLYERELQKRRNSRCS